MTYLVHHLFIEFLDLYKKILFYILQLTFVRVFSSYLFIGCVIEFIHDVNFFDRNKDRILVKNISQFLQNCKIIFQETLYAFVFYITVAILSRRIS